MLGSVLLVDLVSALAARCSSKKQLQDYSSFRLEDQSLQGISFQVRLR
jgi:hypothetical protein